MSQRTYSEDEVKALLKRATELEALRRSGKGDDSTGLTLDEIEAIAADAGLDPESLRIAANELDRPSSVRSTASAAVSGSEISTERWVGGDLTTEAVEEVIAELRHRYGTQAGNIWGFYGRNSVQAIGKSMEWHHTDPLGMYETKVLLQPRDGKVRVRVSLQSANGGSWESSHFWSWLMGIMLALPVGVIAAAVSGSVMIGGLFGLVSVGIVTSLSKNWFDKYSAKHIRKVESLTADVVRMLGAWQRSEPSRRSSTEDPLLDSPEVSGDAEATDRQRRMRIR